MSENEPDAPVTVERTFTCVACGFGATHEVPRLQSVLQATCVSCGDWTTQQAETEAVLTAVRGAVTELAGQIITERQALAYPAREVVGLDRQTTAEAMDTTPSNVDNLARRGGEKVTAARTVVDRLAPYEPADQ